MVFDVYLFCELYLLSLKIFIFVSFKDKFKKKKLENLNEFLNIIDLSNFQVLHEIL